MVGEVGFDLKIMEVLKGHNVSYITKMTNANTIDMIINEDDCTETMIGDLEKRFQTVSCFKAAIVCAIGSNIAKPGIMAAATKALADEYINVLAISQTSRQTNMQFILERDDYKKAQQALHRALCE
jgi:aspartate kinase